MSLLHNILYPVIHLLAIVRPNQVIAALIDRHLGWDRMLATLQTSLTFAVVRTLPYCHFLLSQFSYVRFFTMSIFSIFDVVDICICAREQKSETGFSRRCFSIFWCFDIYTCARERKQVFLALILPPLLCSCETWNLTNGLTRRLYSCVSMSLRRMLGYR